MTNNDKNLYGLPRKLAFGARFPNFNLTAFGGGPFEYHRDLTENPTLIFACRSGEGIADDVSKAVDTAKIQLNIIVVTPETVSQQAEGVRYLSDPSCDLMESIGIPEDTFKFGALMDANQRFVSAYDGRSGISDWLNTWLVTLVYDPPREMTDFAPIISIPRVLEPDFCSFLIDLWKDNHQEGYVSATVDGQAASLLNFDLKRRLDHVIDRPSALYSEISKKIGTVIAPELYKAFQFEKARTEAFYVVRYNDERRDFFAAHRDNNSAATAKRKFAISIDLNDDFEGGGLRFSEFSDHQYRARAGGAIVFSCSLMHEALPVTKGNRFVLLAFLSDPTQ